MAISITFYQFEFLSTPLRGEGDLLLLVLGMSYRISIHAPPWGGRPGHCILWARSRNFYPRPPWGGRPATAGTGDVLQDFLSTPSVGRATVVVHQAAAIENDFYPRPPWGRATPRCGTLPGRRHISIHALRGEGDRDQLPTPGHRTNFYPRPPWGGRPSGRSRPANRLAFLSTPSVGRATLTIFGLCSVD